MDKELYRLLNKARVDLDKYEHEPLGRLETRRLKRRLHTRLRPRRRRIRSTVAIVLCLAVLGLGATHMDRVVHAAMPLLSKLPVFSSLMQDYLIIPQPVLDEYKTTVGQTVTDQGVSIRLDEVLLDDGRLVISTTTFSDRVELDPRSSWFRTIYINGEEIYIPGGGWHSELLENGAIVQLNALDLGDYRLEGDLQLVIEYTQVTTAEGRDIHGRWGFALDTSADELVAATTVIPIDKPITLENGQVFLIDNLTMTPLSVRLNYQHLGGSTYDIRFDVTDQAGNPIEFRSGRSMAQYSHYRFPMPDKGVTSLIFTPHLFSGEEGAAKTDVRIALPEERFEVELPQATVESAD